MLADYHVHTGFSDDSTYPLQRVARDAVRLNLDEVCFTEHVDYGVKPDWDQPATARFEDGRPVTNCPYEPYLAELERVRGELGGKITLRAGLELGVQTTTLDENRALLERLAGRLDFVICSVHQVGDLEFWNGAFQEGRTQDQIHRAYYEELLGVVEAFDGWSVLGHLDLIRRYDPYAREAGAYPFARVRDLVAEILRRAIEKDRGIEVNTSGIRYGLGDFQPSREVLALYRDLGGRVVTVGSDSHKPEHLGSYLRLAYRELEELGFAGVCTFEHGEPELHRF
ncbi:histidinol-phosphatase HisJ family protein [Thermophilibacter sp.]